MDFLFFDLVFHMLICTRCLYARVPNCPRARSQRQRKRLAPASGRFSHSNQQGLFNSLRFTQIQCSFSVSTYCPKHEVNHSPLAAQYLTCSLPRTPSWPCTTSRPSPPALLLFPHLPEISSHASALAPPAAYSPGAASSPKALWV